MDEDETTLLWRPVGPEELELVRQTGWRAWPPRLPGHWRHAWQEGRVREYESRYGCCAEQPLTTWRCPEPVTLTRLEYDGIWQEARQAIDRRF